MQLAIQHVRNDRERMPVPTYRVGKGPRHALWRKAGSDTCVIVDVIRIIIRNELVRRGLAEN